METLYELMKIFLTALKFMSSLSFGILAKICWAVIWPCSRIMFERWMVCFSPFFLVRSKSTVFSQSRPFFILFLKPTSNPGPANPVSQSHGCQSMKNMSPALIVYRNAALRAFAESPKPALGVKTTACKSSHFRLLLFNRPFCHLAKVEINAFQSWLPLLYVRSSFATVIMSLHRLYYIAYRHKG